MEKTNPLQATPVTVPINGCDRRSFLSSASKSILATGIITSLGTLGEVQAQVNNANDMPDPTPVKLPPLDDPSEQEKPQPPAPMAPDKRIGYALVGLGHLTLNQLLPAFGSCKYSKPVALVSGDAAKAASVAQQYGIPPANIYNYQSFDNIKNNKDIQAVYIVLPNGMHEEFTIRAAKAGKHVLCEKPMANNSKEAQNMIDACKAANVKLMIAYRIQYEPKNTYVKEWVRKQEKGKTKLIEMVNAQHIGDPTQWRLNKKLAGGGALPDIGIYCLNTARFLLGEEPLWVNASMYSTPDDPRFKEVEEAVLWQMGFPGGTLVNCSTTYGVHETRRYKCSNDKGASMGLDPAFAYKGLMIEGEYAEGKNLFKHHPTIPDKDQFALEIDHFSQCVMNNQTPYTPGEEGLQDHKIMEAIYQSAREGKPIQLQHVEKKDAFRGTQPQSEE
jgi:predicted dehydrogenase